MALLACGACQLATGLDRLHVEHDGATSSSSSTGGGGGGSGGTGSNIGGGPEGGGGEAPQCAQVSIQDLHYEGEVEGPNGLFDFLHLYLGDFAPSLGSDASDVIELQIAEVDPAPSGQVDLGSGANTDLTSCTVCLLIGVDNTGSPGSYAHVFFQSAGVLDLGTSTSPRVSGSFSGVRLVEVVIDGAGHVTPISGGDCIDVVDENRDALAPVEWTCAESYFADDMGCDCGCGYPDTDCTDSTAGACQYCNEAGSCNTAACPGTIDPTDNSTCM